MRRLSWIPTTPSDDDLNNVVSNQIFPSLSRLMELGIPPYLINATMLGVLGTLIRSSGGGFATDPIPWDDLAERLHDGEEWTPRATSALLAPG